MITMHALQQICFVCFVIIGLYVSEVGCDCNEPPPVTNAYRYLTSNITRSNVTYICYSGYIHRSGNLTRYCRYNGSYDGLPPVCALECGEPRDVMGATKDYNTTSWKSEVNYTCWSNYTQEDPIEDYTGSCQNWFGSWSKLQYRCSENEPINLIGHEASTSDNVSEGRPSDTDPTSCTSTTYSVSPFWIVELGRDYFVDIHRVNILMADTDGLKSIRVDGLIKKEQELKKGQYCASISSNLNTEWMNLNCSSNTYGKYLIITATYSSPSPLKLCEVELYGRIREVNCERHHLIYGSMVDVKATKYLDKSKVSCAPGFVMVAGFTAGKCKENNWWSNVRTVCYDGYVANISTSMIYPGTTNQNLGTCTRQNTTVTVMEPLEIHSVTIQGPDEWPGIQVLVFKNSVSKECFSDGDDHNKSTVRTFYCQQQPIDEQLGIFIVNNENVEICDITVWGRRIFSRAEVFECLEKSNGRDYKGRVAITASGKTCIPWQAMGTLHDIEEFPDFNMIDVGNHCRNPNGMRQAPWCYIDASTADWEYCPILPCKRMCKREADGSDYLGYRSTTISGRPCIQWSSEMNGMEPFYKGFTRNYNSYCRNPGRSQTQPWCITSTSATTDYEHCSIPQCPYYSNLNVIQMNRDQVYNQPYVYIYDDCWQFIVGKKGPASTDLPSLNLTVQMDYLCDDNSYLSLTCYSLNNDEQWYFIILSCDEVLSTTPEPETTTNAMSLSESQTPEPETTADAMSLSESQTPEPESTTDTTLSDFRIHEPETTNMSTSLNQSRTTHTPFTSSQRLLTFSPNEQPLNTVTENTADEVISTTPEPETTTDMSATLTESRTPEPETTADAMSLSESQTPEPETTTDTTLTDFRIHEPETTNMSTSLNQLRTPEPETITDATSTLNDSQTESQTPEPETTTYVSSTLNISRTPEPETTTGAASTLNNYRTPEPGSTTDATSQTLEPETTTDVMLTESRTPEPETTTGVISTLNDSRTSEPESTTDTTLIDPRTPELETATNMPTSLNQSRTTHTSFTSSQRLLTFSPNEQPLNTVTENTAGDLNSSIINGISNDLCHCACFQRVLNYSDRFEVEENIQKIKKILQIDKTVLINKKQRYISLVDDRPSVVYIGGSAVCLFIIPIVFILGIDFITLYRFITSQ